ncbi:hypothetical protein OCU04_005376 [Sclerotinia nivalis]|uniref:Uncharacterized protein n=1 Tax=Sclerotinia nivalis TaxID=352851 RepID=A0A9X0AP10_9HELO|nr:hypothetical protein OCU04_005376 [Sclerotinia nivalis]
MDHKTPTMTALEVEVAWTKWKHPWNTNNAIHPWAPQININDMIRTSSPNLLEVLERASFEEANYTSLTREDLELPPFSLQALLFKSDDLTTTELQRFCGKASMCYDVTGNWETEPRGRKVAVLHRVYGEWFKLVPSNTVETRFFTRYIGAEGFSSSDLEGIVRAHKRSYEKIKGQTERLLKTANERLGDEDLCREFTVLPTLRDLVIIVDGKASLDPATLLILKPSRAEGIEALGSAEQRELDGERVLVVRMKMEQIMRVVVEMQNK